MGFFFLINLVGKVGNTFPLGSVSIKDDLLKI